MIDTWWAAPSALEDSLRAESPLSRDERARMARFRFQADRDRFLTAWNLTRTVLGELLGRAPSAVVVTRECLHCGHPEHGKPRVPDDPVHFSLSHADDRVLLAVSQTGPVGADVEVRGRAVADIGALASHPEESAAAGAELLRRWVRKEAVVKATGHGLVVAMNRFAVSAADRPAKLLSWPLDPSLPDRTVLDDLPAPSGYLAATALILPSAQAAAAG